MKALEHAHLLQQSAIIFLIILICPSNSRLTFFCDPSQAVQNIHINSTAEADHIHTVHEGQTEYGNNYFCTWIIETNSSHKISLKVISSGLQFAPTDGICTGYDYVSVLEVFPNETERNIVTWCGDRNPGYIISSTNKVKVIFSSNSQNIYTYSGVDLEFRAFTACPPDWSSFSDYCYQQRNSPRTWNQAQEHCGYCQSNLVSLKDENEKQFVRGLIQYQQSWIGLNDIESDGNYKWIDATPYTVTTMGWSASHKSESNRDCVGMDSSGQYYEDRCDEELNKKGFLCKRSKDSATHVYPVPKGFTDKGGNNTQPSWFQWPIMVACIALAVILIVIIVVLVNRHHRRLDYARNSSENVRNTSNMASSSSMNNTPNPRSLDSHLNGCPTQTDRQGVSQPAPLPGHPPTYSEAVAEDVQSQTLTKTNSNERGTHVHVHVHMPNVQTTD